MILKESIIKHRVRIIDLSNDLTIGTFQPELLLKKVDVILLLIYLKLLNELAPKKKLIICKYIKLIKRSMC